MAHAYDVTENQRRRHGNLQKRIPRNYESGATGHNKYHHINSVPRASLHRWKYMKHCHILSMHIHSYDFMYCSWKIDILESSTSHKPQYTGI